MFDDDRVICHVRAKMNPGEHANA